MTTINIDDAEKLRELREELAALAHQQWLGWMDYLFNKCEMKEDGTAVIPKWAVERWQRQMTTNYSALPEDEKISDREEADRVFHVIYRIQEKGL